MCRPSAGRFGELADRRQEAGQRLARAGRRDQQAAAPGPSEREHVELVAARSPSALGEPAFDDFRERSLDQRPSVPSRRRRSSSS